MEKFQREHFQTDTKQLDPWYITGFSDGESTFTYSRSGKNICLYFAIKLVFEDRDILYKIKDFFRVGRIYVGKPVAPGKYSGHTRTYFYYRVSRITELNEIINHFDKYPLVGKKLKSYNIWKEMVAAKMRYRRPNRCELEKLAKRLSSLTGRNPATAEDVKDNRDM